MCLQLTLIPLSLSLVHSLSLTLSHSLKKFFKLAASNRIRRALRNRPRSDASRRGHLLESDSTSGRVELESGSHVAKNLRGRQGFAHVRVDVGDIGDDIGVVHKLRPAARVAPVKGRQQGWSTVR